MTLHYEVLSHPLFVVWKMSSNTNQVLLLLLQHGHHVLDLVTVEALLLNQLLELPRDALEHFLHSGDLAVQRHQGLEGGLDCVRDNLFVRSG